MFKTILKLLKMSAIATVGLAVVGGIISLIAGAPFLQGAYIAVMIGAVVPMVGAIYAFAAPSTRIKYFKKEVDEDTKGAESLPFALAGILMMAVAFFLESLMHL